MNTADSGKRVANILQARGVPVQYHVIPGIGHYGEYAEKFNETTEMELAWFDKTEAAGDSLCGVVRETVERGRVTDGDENPHPP